MIRSDVLSDWATGRQRGGHRSADVAAEGGSFGLFARVFFLAINSAS
jgi:hypothetical protein